MAGQVGVALPNDFSNIEGTGSISGVTLRDLDLATSAAYGAKVGYFFDSVKWLGVETEFYHANPHIKQQQVTACFAGVCESVVSSGAHMRVRTVAFNLIARYPGEQFQPYAGVGLGLFFAKISDETGSAKDTAPGLNVVVGSRFFLSKSVALFGEYKYNRASFKFDNAFDTGAGLKGDYSANLFVFGVGYHF